MQVEIEYQQTLRYDQGAFRLRFPMTLTPRYIPAAVAGESQHTVAVQDAAGISPPFAPPFLHPATAYRHPLTMLIELEAGFPLASLSSAYHAIDVKDAAGAGAGRNTITLREGAVAANKDFELVWAPQRHAAPQAALFHELKDGQQYALLMVMPPSSSETTASLPRETIFIVDTSGSMQGQCQAASGVATLWARDKIEDLMSTLRVSENEALVKAAVIDTALAHHLVSQYTSLVAVDGTPARHDGAPSKTAIVPSMLPEGASHDALFGTLPQTATPAQLNLLIGLTMLPLAGMRRLMSRQRWLHQRGGRRG